MNYNLANSRLSYLLARVEDLERYATAAHPPALLHDDVEALVFETLSYASRSLDLQRLNERLKALAAIDFDSLHKAEQIFREAGLQDAIRLSSEVTYNPAGILADLARAITQLETGFSKLDDFSLSFALDTSIGFPFDEALVCVAAAGKKLRTLRELVQSKLSLLSDEQLSSFWSRLLREWNPNRPHAMKDPDSLLPPRFLEFQGMQRTGDKIAQYLCDLRPKLVVSMIRNGVSKVPMEGINLPRILAWRSAHASEPVSDQEELLAGSVARLVSILQRLFHKRPDEVRAFLGLPAGSRLLEGPEFQKADREFSKLPPTFPSVFLELRKIARFTDSLVLYECSVERALRQYKLGLEVMTPEILSEICKKKELLLQKELCRFLLERNIFAQGTRFGRSETDLVAEEPGARYVLETKVFRQRAGLRENAIKQAVTQLQSYLDQSPATPRGVLVIYNFTESLLTAPLQWIQGRLWILPINLQREPPSGRKRSFSIELGGDNRLIEVVVNLEGHNSE